MAEAARLPNDVLVAGWNIIVTDFFIYCLLYFCSFGEIIHLIIVISIGLLLFTLDMVFKFCDEFIDLCKLALLGHAIVEELSHIAREFICEVEMVEFSWIS